MKAAPNNGHTDVVNLLLERRANISAKSTNGRTALMVAANAAITKALIERGAKLEEVDNAGRTPLMAAASHGNTEVENHVK